MEKEPISQRQAKELDLLASSASDIIVALLNVMEDVDPKYSSRDLILEADDWLKWCNGELTDEDAHIVCKNLTGYDY